MLNKRGQGLSTNAIVLIILGVVVLTVMIIGFTMGWDRLAPWLSSGDNLAQLNTECKTACATLSTADFCSKQKTVRITEAIGSINDKDKKTCDALSKVPETGVDKCPAITC
ncbi:MAG: hypothetical protein ABH811_00360 [archaeon]